jgi:hypothetical protein
LREAGPPPCQPSNPPLATSPQHLRPAQMCSPDQKRAHTVHFSAGCTNWRHCAKPPPRHVNYPTPHSLPAPSTNAHARPKANPCGSLFGWVEPVSGTRGRVNYPATSSTRRCVNWRGGECANSGPGWEPASGERKRQAGWGMHKRRAGPRASKQWARRGASKRGARKRRAGRGASKWRVGCGVRKRRAG